MALSHSWTTRHGVTAESPAGMAEGEDMDDPFRSAGAGCPTSSARALRIIAPFDAAGTRQSGAASRASCTANRLSLSELRSTDTLDRDMAALANTGDRRKPVNGSSRPAASGMPTTL